MNLRLTLLNRMNTGIGGVLFVLYKDIEVLSEVMPKTFLMMVAEIGGYLGLTLGISLMDLKFAAPSSLKFLQIHLFKFTTD